VTLTGNVHDAFWHELIPNTRCSWYRGQRGIENNRITGSFAGTKVTIGFGMASAIIKLDWCTRGQKNSK